MKKFPETITIRISSKCNYNRKCCYGPKNIEGLSLQKLKEIFKLLPSNGARSIVLTGGEPLAREDIDEIILFIKKCNMKIFLDTNGSLFFEHKRVIDENVDVLGLPIYSSKNDYKGTPKLDPILKILDYYKTKEKTPIIRIGTVLTKENFDEIKDIGELIKNYPVNIWKIYEFLPQNVNAVNNMKELEIPKDKIDEIKKVIIDKFSKYFKVVISFREKRNKAYFFIDPDGNVFMPIDDGNICREMTIGNIFDVDILDKWRKIVSEDNYISNIKETFVVNNK